jgi:hypothetical protein
MKCLRSLTFGLFLVCALGAGVAASQPKRKEESVTPKAPLPPPKASAPSREPTPRAPRRASPTNTSSRPDTDAASKSHPTAKIEATEVASPEPAASHPQIAVSLKDVEGKVEKLREKVRRQRIFFEAIDGYFFPRGESGSQASVRFENDLSSAFVVTGTAIALDGVVQFEKHDAGGDIGTKPITLFEGRAPVGRHTVQVLVTLQGNGYGVFSYLKDFKYDVRSSHSFTLLEESTMTIDVSTFEKESIVGKLEDRPGVRFEDHLSRGLSSLPRSVP